MSADVLVGRIGELVREVLYVDVPAPDTDLVEAGLVDSLALVSLITEIERVFGFEMPLDDFDVERFRSVGAIAAYVAEMQPEVSG